MTSLQEFELEAELWEAAAPAVRSRDTHIVIPTSSQLTTLRGYGGKTIPLLAATFTAYQNLLAAARQDGIAPPLLQIVSGFRTVRQQEALWQRALARYGSPDVARRWVASPGNSVHQSGRAIDFWMGSSNSSANASLQRKTAVFRWLTQNAARFDFVPYAAEPWHWEYTPAHPALEASPASSRAAAASPAPNLLAQEDAPPSKTLYVSIPLGSYGPAGASQPIPSTTGIFLPRDFRPTTSVDVLLYLQGHHPDAPRRTIREYWNASRFPHWAFREGLNNSGKNYVLVAPTLGPRSESGWLSTPGGIGRYLDRVLAALAAYTPFVTSSVQPRIGNLILACHSGGGWPMRQIAISGGRYANLIRECWGFDCLYNGGDEDAWAGWGRANPAARLFVYYLGSTAARSQRLAKLSVSNIQVARSTAPDHNHVPITHWPTRLSGASI